MKDRVNLDGGERRLAVLSAWAKDGALDFESPGRLKTTLVRCEGKRLTVTLALDQDKRSNEANNYAFGVVYPEILTELREKAFREGWTVPWKKAEDVHVAMKYLILGEVEEEIGGVKVMRETPTRTMTTAEYHSYIERVKAFAAEKWGIYVSDPR